MKKNYLKNLCIKYENNDFCKYFYTNKTTLPLYIEHFNNCENIFISENLFNSFQSDKIMLKSMKKVIKIYYKYVK
jgi:hypothetical protein